MIIAYVRSRLKAIRSLYKNSNDCLKNLKRNHEAYREKDSFYKEYKEFNIL